MEVAYGLAAIQSAMTCLKGLSAGLKAIKEIDQKLSILDLRQKLVEIEESLLEAKEQTNELIRENQELSRQLALQKEVFHQEDGNILWRIENEQKRGPYCSTCYGGENKLISLSMSDPGSWHCPKCKNHFHTLQWVEERNQQHDQITRQLYRSF